MHVPECKGYICLDTGWYLKTLCWFHERFDISLSYQIFLVSLNTLNRCMKRPKKTQGEKSQITFLNLPNKIQTILEFRFVLLTDRDFPLETQRFHLPYSHAGKFVVICNIKVTRSYKMYDQLDIYWKTFLLNKKLQQKMACQNLQYYTVSASHWIMP